MFFLGSPSHDAAPETSILRPANFDNVNGCVWDSTTSACEADVEDLDLPASLYRSGKPGWFGDAAWPPIGPDVEGGASTIPAEIRYQALTGG